MVMWQMIERNKFLEDKLGKLRRQQQKQHSAIEKIENSEEGRGRLGHCCSHCRQTHCQGNDKCHFDRYVQLLRVRSPFF